ncbi:MAG: metal-dependent transcriptional regulator [Candidatus Heimdallarchaeota archaeon]|nr:metal-dependent transcriptional regulator [Candidatus Heimdallarchaeota archaeon]MCK4954025.1 metal-dependent transcriptional regulator [Candidatus Heimdallarchaeota archaeon]
MTQKEVTAAEEEYLETFFWFFEYGRKDVKTNQIAEMMNVDPGTVTSMFKKLSRKGFIDYKPYYGAKLTSEGEDIARKIVRNHRLSESFLEWLGVPWSKIHEEACKWEHVLTEEIAEMIEQKLNPEKTPYGATIPQKEGSVSTDVAIKPLALFSSGKNIEIVEILERAIARHFPHEATLQEVYIELEEKGLKPETKLKILSVFKRDDISIEKWSLSYDIDMQLENEKGVIIEIPYFLVNMVLAKEVEK